MLTLPYRVNFESVQVGSGQEINSLNGVTRTEMRALVLTPSNSTILLIPLKVKFKSVIENLTSKRAIPDVGASCVSVQLKQLRMVTSDLFLPWKFSLIDSRKHSDGG